MSGCGVLMKSIPDLLPCPFCGCGAEMIKGHTVESDAWPHGDFWRVYCGACQVRQLYHRSPLQAALAWNKRDVPRALEEDAWRYRELRRIAMKERAIESAAEADAEVDGLLRERTKRILR
jgi:hypothetical protein